ncbi:MAG: IS1380 family transposase [Acidimicrobiaceae bacterium]|nr:IS1380 family transposase [Acidimicrobiaceae bacterium]
MSSITGGVDGLGVRFDDGSLVADAGLVLAGTVMARLGLEALIDEAVRPPESGRGSGAKALSAAASMLVGGSFIDDANRLRSGSAEGVLPFAVSAPSTLGTWLGSFRWGHVRQLDRAQELALSRAWSVGAAPRVSEVTVDVDSTVCEVHGRAEQGAAYGHTGVLGYHPLVAVRDDTGEILHTRMRKGSSQSGQRHFIVETLTRLKRLEPDAAVTVRADAGFFSYGTLDALDAKDASYSVTIPQSSNVKAAIEAIEDEARAPIGCTDDGIAQVAETTITTGPRSRSAECRALRLVVRRTRLAGPQRALWPDWRHHAFVTNRTDLDTTAADACHRAHARVELAIRDLKDNGLAHCPSGKFAANAAWLACAALAHNIARWCARLGRAQHPRRLTTAATLRRRLLNIPGRIVNHSGRNILRLPADWPWTHTFTQALKHIRNLPQIV